MKIKKHKNTKNEYISAGDVWIRNFTKGYVKPLSISSMFQPQYIEPVMFNEIRNIGYSNISEEKLVFPKVVIVSDGYKFNQRHKELLDFPKDVFVIAINGSLRRWSLMNKANTEIDRRRAINCYVVNNPYPECLTYLPSKESLYFPPCIGSIRTNSEFLKRYMGNTYTYAPAPEINFGSRKVSTKYYIDDYRSPVCAAIGLAYQFQAKKIMLMCCDNSFEEELDGSVKLENGLWTYPPHIKSHDIIDGNLYWLTHIDGDEIVAANYSSGPKYKNATYISNKDEALNFFADEEEQELLDE